MMARTRPFLTLTFFSIFSLLSQAFALDLTDVYHTLGNSFYNMIDKNEGMTSFLKKIGLLGGVVHQLAAVVEAGQRVQRNLPHNGLDIKHEHQDQARKAVDGNLRKKDRFHQATDAHHQREESDKQMLPFCRSVFLGLGKRAFYPCTLLREHAAFIWNCIVPVLHLDTDFFAASRALFSASLRFFLSASA